MAPWLHIVGIGEDGLGALPPEAVALIERAEVLVGGERHLAMVPASGAERMTWRSPLKDTVADLGERAGRRVVVLATGDPMDFGIGVTLARAFGIEQVRMLPAPGAFALACSRLGWARAEVECLTLHGRPSSILRRHARPGARLLILAHDGETPRLVAEMLVVMGLGASRLVALEHMGGPRERRVEGVARDWPERRCADLVTVAAECRAEPGAAPLIGATGLADDAFRHDGQITKRAVRAVTLARLAPSPFAHLWDVGAGAGSIAIEWLRACSNTAAHAIEHDPARIAIIRENADRLGVPHLDIVHGEAPDALAGLPAPDAVFVGGGLAKPGLVERCWQALKPGGRLVANAVTVEGEATLGRLHAEIGGDLVRLAVATAEPVGSLRGWRPAMPVTQWAVDKPW